MEDTNFYLQWWIDSGKAWIWRRKLGAFGISQTRIHAQIDKSSGNVLLSIETVRERDCGQSNSSRLDEIR
jgi:hypothetical protein